MRVQRTKLPNLPVERLDAIESVPPIGVYEGCTVGYRCRLCGQADEDIQEVLHEEHCELCGEHGRDKYDELPQVHIRVEGSEEISPEHPITLIVADWTDKATDVWREDVIAFRCDQCGNLDETLFEIVHDEACDLSSDGGTSPAEIVDALNLDLDVSCA